MAIEARPWCPTFVRFHLTSKVVSQPESCENPEVNVILEISLIYSWQCLTCCLQWPCPQFLLILCVPNTTTVSFTWTPSIQCINMPHEVEHVRTGNCCSSIPLLLTNTKTMESWDTAPHLIILYPLKVMITRLVTGLIKWAEVYNPTQNTVCMTVIPDYHIIQTIRQLGFNAEVSHHHGVGEQYYMRYNKL